MNVDALLESPEADPKTASVERLNRALAAANELEARLDKQRELVRELIYTLRVNHAFADKGVDPDNVERLLTHDLMRGQSLGGRVSKFRNEYEMEDTDIIGVQLKDGQRVVFDAPIRSKGRKTPAMAQSTYTGEVPPKKKRLSSSDIEDAKSAAYWQARRQPR
jgi:hypothetical protein